MSGAYMLKLDGDDFLIANSVVWTSLNYPNKFGLLFNFYFMESARTASLFLKSGS